jgi:hypothetical protein
MAYSHDIILDHVSIEFAGLPMGTPMPLAP